MNLALFDLDNTLIPLDSDHGWADFLIQIGAIDGTTFKTRNDAFYEQYKAQTLNIYEYLEFVFGFILAAHPRAQLEAWRERFLAEVIQPNLKPAALALVQKHREAGDLCAVVTATNSFVTAPIAALFGIPHLIATEPEIDSKGEFTGAVAGLPSFREGKITRVEAWLAEHGKRWGDFEQSWFYSDSANDLPLLERVTHPVAVNADPTLSARAQAAGWPILTLFCDNPTP